MPGPRLLGLVERRHRPLWVLAVSGVIGFFLGIARFATEQVAVEAAQVVAGLVVYPPDNPFYIYQMQLWTVVHQIGALLLRAGVTEIALSRLLSGLIGMISFQALSLLAYTFSEDVLLALATPVLILFTRASDYGVTYPVSLLGTIHTYGVLGLSTLLLVVALLGAGCYRLGGLLLGVAPAVHPSLGGWLWVIVAIGVWWDFTRLRAAFRVALPYVMVGCVLTSLSFAAQQVMAHGITRLDAAVSSRYLAALVTAWDEHRLPVDIGSVGVLLNVQVLLVSIVWLTAFVDGLPPAPALAMRALASSTALSLPLMFVSWLPPSLVPPAVLVLMPSRYLNVGVLAFVPLTLGLLGVYRRSIWSQLVVAGFAFALIVTGESMPFDVLPASRFVPLNPFSVFTALSIALIVVRATPAWMRTTTMAALAALATMTSRALPAGILAVAAVVTWRLPDSPALFDRTNDALFAAISMEKNGLLATAGSTQLVQLRTRRPVLFDGGALDMLAYAPAAGPAMDAILRGVYDIDFFNPPEALRGFAVIADDFNKAVWERYPRRKWEEIGRRFDVTQVLTDRSYALDLPMAAEDAEFRLYVVPR